MIMKVLERIESVRTRNQLNVKAINKDLYKLLYNQKLLTIAYNKIKSTPQRVTPSKNIHNLNEYYSCIIEKTSINLKNHSFKFNIENIKDIQKNNNKKTFFKEIYTKNKIVQKTILIILEAIYEPTFSSYNNSFQKRYCCHNTVKEIKNQWTNVKWVLEGSIEPSYENLDHKILLKILRKKIQDERFIQLIWKLIRVQIKNNGVYYTSKKGISKKGILSSLLLKIYENEFDVFLEELRLKSTKKPLKTTKYTSKITKSRICRLTKPTSRRRIKLSKFYQEKFKESRELPKTQIPILFTSKSHLKCRKIKFVRYEKNWKFAIKGPKTLAKNLKKIIEIFINSTFKLMMSSIKVKISYFSEGTVEFFGYLLKIKRLSFQAKNPKGNKENIGIKINFYIPIDNIIRKLYEKNFSTKSGKGRIKKGWIMYPDNLIIQKYNNLLRGLQNYYSLGSNYRSSVNRITHILKFSCAHTLAGKHRSSLSVQIKRLTCVKLDSKCDKYEKTKNFKMCNQTIETNFWPYNHNKTNTSISCNACSICNRNEKLEIHHIKTFDRENVTLQNEKIHTLMQHISVKNRCLCTICQLNLNKRNHHISNLNLLKLNKM